jgi:hypothetical protein
MCATIDSFLWHWVGLCHHTTSARGWDALCHTSTSWAGGGNRSHARWHDDASGNHTFFWPCAAQAAQLSQERSNRHGVVVALVPSRLGCQCRKGAHLAHQIPPGRPQHASQLGQIGGGRCLPTLERRKAPAVIRGLFPRRDRRVDAIPLARRGWGFLAKRMCGFIVRACHERGCWCGVDGFLLRYSEL